MFVHTAYSGIESRAGASWLMCMFIIHDHSRVKRCGKIGGSRLVLGCEGITSGKAEWKVHIDKSGIESASEKPMLKKVATNARLQTCQQATNACL
jgi:hypothetical protein